MMIPTIALPEFPGAVSKPAAGLGVSFADLLASLEPPTKGEDETVKTFAFRDLGVFGLGRPFEEHSTQQGPQTEFKTTLAPTPPSDATTPAGPTDNPAQPVSSATAIPEQSAPTQVSARPIGARYDPASKSSGPAAAPAQRVSYEAIAPAGDTSALSPVSRLSIPEAAPAGEGPSIRATVPAVAADQPVVEVMSAAPEVASSSIEPAPPEQPASSAGASQPARRPQPARELRLNPLTLFEDAGRAGLAFQCASLSPGEFQAFRRRAETLLEEHGLALIRLSHNGKTQSKVLSQGEGGASWR